MENQKRFIDNGDGTVTDTKLKLIWKQNDGLQDVSKWTNWYDSLGYIKELNIKKFAGCGDWRMPTLKEAESLFYEERDVYIRDMDRFEIFIDPVFSPGGGYTSWTSTSKPNGCALIFYYRYGHENSNHKEDISKDTVRAVRNATE